jgi:hypothetical protein
VPTLLNKSEHGFKNPSECALTSNERIEGIIVIVIIVATTHPIEYANDARKGNQVDHGKNEKKKAGRAKRADGLLACLHQLARSVIDSCNMVRIDRMTQAEAVGKRCCAV